MEETRKEPANIGLGAFRVCDIVLNIWYATICYLVPIPCKAKEFLRGASIPLHITESLSPCETSFGRACGVVSCNWCIGLIDGIRSIKFPEPCYCSICFLFLSW